jgi:hypothetical protein
VAPSRPGCRMVPGFHWRTFLPAHQAGKAVRNFGES